MMTDWRCRVTALVAAGALLASGCVAAAAFADEPAAPAADGTGATVTVKNETGFAQALSNCNASKTATTIAIGENITLTPDKINNSNNKVTCPLTIVSDGGNWTVTWMGDGSMLWPQSGFTVTIGVAGASGNDAVSGNRLTFTHPADGQNHGPLFHNYGTLAIHGGTFKGLRVAKGGVAQNDGALTVDGGVFSGNVSSDMGGGVFFQSKGSMTITGGEFRGNANTRKGRNVGGGVIRMEGGSLDISGGTFEENHMVSGDWFSGGGAVYAKGSLTISGGEFKNNWAADLDEYPGAEDKIPGGGAGGAVFLQEYSATSYILGGTFTGNVSGYLGGAIYTEEHTTTYVGPAVAYDNTAGHFGGGLWFCPSGNAEASEGGNIALFDNNVDETIDANEENWSENAGFPTMAGDDLSIMNPYAKKDHVHDNKFELLDTWFTDRNKAAVDWYWDGRPATESSGFSDSYMQGNNTAVKAYEAGDKDLPESIKNDGTYLRYGAGTNVRQEKGTLSQHWGDGDKNNTYGGIALKSVPKSDELKNQAKAGAKISISGNRARLSGGGFGSNGRVVFATPYTAAWEKVDAADNTVHLGGSRWKVSTAISGENAGGAFKPQMGVDADCEAGSQDEECWAHRNDDRDGYMSIIVADYDSTTDKTGQGATGRDNNPDPGRLSIDNLKPGVYMLTEIQAPGGFKANDTVYTFTIKDGQTETPAIGYENDPGDDTVVGDGNRKITNERRGGLAWTKTDTSGVALGGSQWTITGPGDSRETLNVTDCEGEDVNACANTNDSNPAKGELQVTGLKPGKYTLKESKAPEGHWLDTTAYTFEITGNTDKSAKLFKPGETDQMETNTITNKPTEVSWLKVGIDDQNTPLAGSVWTLVRVEDGGGNKITEGDSTKNRWDVVDCQPAGTDKVASCDDLDQDDASGKFKLVGLEAGTYNLTEKTAPDGYVKSGKTYTFKISQEEPTEKGTVIPVSIDGAIQAEGINKIVNAKSVTALPLTGGRSALDWAVTGGVLAILAGGVAVVADRLRRRAGVR